MENNFFSKNDFINCVKELILPLEPYYSDGFAELKFGTHSSGQSEKTQRTEAFMRPLWGLAPLWGGGGECTGFDEIYVKGIVNGTNPEHPEYWGELRSYSQEVCEAPALALSLLLARKKLWDPLSESEKENIAIWLF